MPVVFGRSSKNTRLIAILLPLTFVWSWAACSLACSELVERHHVQNETIDELEGEDRLNAFEMDGCPLTSSAAVLETRQTVNSPATVNERASTAFQPKYIFTQASVYKSDLNQNSPPASSLGPPLFLRHRAFRI